MFSTWKMLGRPPNISRYLRPNLRLNDVMFKHIVLHYVFFFSKIVLNGCSFKTTRLLNIDGPIWHFFPMCSPVVPLSGLQFRIFQPIPMCSALVPLSGLQLCFFNPSLCAVLLCHFARSNLVFSGAESAKLEHAKRDQGESSLRYEHDDGYDTSTDYDDDHICSFPRHPNTCWDGVSDIFWGSKYLLNRCLDV